ncbi:hypothetical protein ABPG72_017275 [Tetrahymena utriculariae]
MTQDQYQDSQNKTKIVYKASFYYSKANNQFGQYLELDIIKCIDPQLKGMLRIDFSQVSNSSLILDTQNKITSQISVRVSGCLDLDMTKTSIPNNCADQNQIDDVINQVDTVFTLKLKFQQYNTTSKQIQTNYRNVANFLSVKILQFQLSKSTKARDFSIIRIYVLGLRVVFISHIV